MYKTVMVEKLEVVRKEVVLVIQEDVVVVEEGAVVEKEVVVVVLMEEVTEEDKVVMVWGERKRPVAGGDQVGTNLICCVTSITHLWMWQQACVSHLRFPFVRGNEGKAE